MSLSLVQSRALLGLQAAQVTVEVHLANGLPSFTLVGLADVEVKEARERVRCAIQNSGLTFPNNQRITVNLAPADLPKDSGRLDLPIAMGILAASGQVDDARLKGFEFAGELSLSGELRPVRGALATALTLQTNPGTTKLVLPPGSAEEAALVPGAQVYRARHLLDVVRQFLPTGTAAPEANGATADADGWARLEHTPVVQDRLIADMTDVKGQAGAKRVLEIAAAGGHSGDAVGTLQDDALRQHTHGVTEMIFNDDIDGLDSTTTRHGEHHNESRQTGITGGCETRPLNVAMHWLILAGPPASPEPPAT